jgi:hypothetical protein
MGFLCCPYYDGMNTYRFWRTEWCSDMWVRCESHSGPCELCPGLLNPGNVQYHDCNDGRCKYCAEHGISLGLEELKAERARLASRCDSAILPVQSDKIFTFQVIGQRKRKSKAQGQTTTDQPSEGGNATLSFEKPDLE